MHSDDERRDGAEADHAPRQGWNRDPFGRFEHRYFSAGRPTALVRTDGIESRDEPTVRAATEVTHPPTAPRPAPRVVPRYVLYQRRQHRVLASMLLVAAFVMPLLGWELLVSTGRDRVLGAIAYVLLLASLAGMVRIFRAPPAQRRRPSARPTPTH